MPDEAHPLDYSPPARFVRPISEAHLAALLDETGLPHPDDGTPTDSAWSILIGGAAAVLVINGIALGLSWVFGL